jgi:outer membrane receptor protein involved in Fe transport
LREQFFNRARARTTGMALQADFMSDGPVSARATYSFQRTRDEESDEQLTNSPAHVASFSIMARSREGLHTAATLRCESGRLTLQGTSTEAFARADFTVGYSLASAGVPSWGRAVRASIRVTNLFDTPYAVPGGFEHVQASLPQRGRAVMLRLDWHR